MMESEDDRLDQTFAALANSTRRAILARLAEGEATVNELAAPFNMSLAESAIPALHHRRITPKRSFQVDRAVPSYLGGAL